MYIYLFAGLFLLTAIVFIIKFFIDMNKSKKEPSAEASVNDGLTIITQEDENKKPNKSNTRKDVILAIVFMILCEVCVLLGNYVIEI